MKKFMGIQYIGNNKFIIVLQSHRNEEFGVKSHHFSYNDIGLSSCAVPAEDGNRLLFVRGDETERDWKIIGASSSNIHNYLTVIRAYNEYFR